MSEFFNVLRYEDAPKDWNPDWHVNEMWQVNGLNFIWGAPKSHKSMLRRYLLACAVAGRPAFDRLSIDRKVENALVFLSEDHPGAERNKMDTIFREFGLADDWRRPITFTECYGFSLREQGHINKLLKLVETEGFDFIAIDPLINYHTADENNATEVARVTTALHLIAHMATVVCIHHTSKAPIMGKNERSAIEQGRGSSVWGGAADTALHLVRRGQSLRHTAQKSTKSAPDDAGMDLRLNTNTWIWTMDLALSVDAVLAYLQQNPKQTSTEIAKGLGRRRQSVEKVLEEMAEAGDVVATGFMSQRKEWSLG